MMGTIVKLIIAALLVLVTLPGYADIIIDTGAPPPSSTGQLLDPNNWVAGQFVLDQAYTITDVEAWMIELSPGNMSVAIYGDDGGVPGAAYFSWNFQADNLIDGPLGAQWQGLHGVNWNLDAGTWWVTFLVNRDSASSFILPFDAPSPLSAYGSYNNVDDDWSYFESSNGYRIQGFAQNGPIPEPASMALLGFGLAGLALYQRKHK
jgi:hypothetical protein